jgi:sugar/nucleoside kinase (ribokinase family)
MTDLLVVGSVALDSVETPSGSVVEALGGSATYFSAAASLLTGVRVVAVVGDDFPEEHLETLRKREIDLEGLQRVPGRTFRWTGRYTGDLNQAVTLDTQLNVFESFDPELPGAYQDSAFVFLANTMFRMHWRLSSSPWILRSILPRSVIRLRHLAASVAVSR